MMLSEVLLLTWCLFGVVRAGKVYHVCPEAVPHAACPTLSNYTAFPDLYFSSNNTIFSFLAGTHLLEGNMTFSDVADICLKSSNESKEVVIECSADTGLTFENVTNLMISGLTIKNCSMIKTGIIKDDIPLRVGLYLSDIINFNMSRVNIQDSKGFGFFSSCLYGHVIIDDSIFDSNQANDSVQKYNGGNAALTYLNCPGYDTQHAHVGIYNSQFLHGLSIHRHIATGLVIYLEYPNIDVSINNAIMAGNIAKYTDEDYEPRDIQGGNLAVIYYDISRNNTVKIRNSSFDGGEALMGAGMYVLYFLNTRECTNQLIVENSNFTNNIAHKDGGAICLELIQGISSRERMNCDATNNFVLNECLFSNNSVKTNDDAGIGITITNFYLHQFFSSQYTYYSILLFNCLFEYNSNTPLSDGSYSSGSAVLYSSYQVGRLMIEDCTFIHNEVTAMAAFRSHLYFSGNVTIHNNTGYEGGGIVLCEASFMIINPYTTLTISSNHANVSGGGIFAESRCAQSEPLCYYQLNKDSHLSMTEILNTTKINMINNTADYAGSQIFGGTVDNCHIPNYHHDIFFELFDFIYPHNDTSYISSDPLNVCFCNEMVPDCNIESQNFSVYSGQKFNVSLVTVGQYNGTVPGVVDLRLSDSDHGVIVTDAVAPLEKECTDKSVTIYTNKSKAWVKVQVKNQHANYLLNSKVIQLIVNIKDTPIGFISTGNDNEPYECTKTPDITQAGFKCLIENNTGVIQRPVPKWLGFYNTSNNTSSGLMLHLQCPLDYCYGQSQNVSIITTSTDFSQDLQCSNNRSGILCGMCKRGYSISTGSSICINCTGYPIAKTIGWSIMFLFSGIVFVFLLLLINFTVTQGILSELLFYANTFFIFKSTLLPNTNLDSLYQQLLNLIIYVINLNYGYNNCFYHKLDMVGRIWLQFLLVIYLWMIAIVIVLLCRKFTRFANFIGYNSVQVLATILLFSYSSVNLCIIYSLTFTYFNLPGSEKRLFVMFYDGNIPYFDKKHIPLFIVGSIFAILSFAFTLTLLCIQPLQRYSHWRLLKWVNKLKPLIDAYTCPHIIKPHCRFWNGFLLLVRSFMYIIFITGYDHQKVLAGINSACIIVLATAWALGGVYERKYLNYLSSSYIINLGMLSIAVTYFSINRNWSYSITASCVSITIATVTLLGTVLYQILMQLHKKKCFINISRLLPQKSKIIFRKLCCVFKRSNYQPLTGYANNVDGDEYEVNMSFNRN